MTRLEFSSNFRVYFGPENPELLAFEEFQATYSKNDNILFVIRPPDGGVFTPSALDALERLTAEAWNLPHVSRVDSLTNFQHTRADGDDLVVEDLVRGARDWTVDDLERVRQVAMSEPLLHGGLLAPDAGAAGVNATLQLPEDSLDDVSLAVGAARELAARIEREYPGTVVALTGIAVLNQSFTEAGMTDARTLMPLMFVVLTLFMVLCLRNVLAALSALAVVGLSTLAAMGLAGYAGIQLSPIAVNAPVIILTLAVADGVHILTSLLSAMRDGADKATALRESLRINFVAVMISSVTTIFGFLTLNFSDAPPFHALGNIVAMGIAMALICSLTLLPALVVLLPIRTARRRRQGASIAERLDTFAEWVVSRRGRVLVGSGLVVLSLASLMPNLELDDQWVRYFDERVRFRRDALFTEQHLTGLYPVEFSVPSGEAEGMHAPPYLRRLDQFTAWLRDQPEVRHVNSYSDVARRLNKSLHGDAPEYYRIPDDRSLAAQYLLTYELSLPFGLDLNDRIALDRGATRVTATIGDVSTRETRDFLRRAEAWFRDHMPPEQRAIATGPAVMFSYISERNIDSMLRGNLIAVALISVIMMVALRSFGLGLLSLIPNTAPLLMTFGLWTLTAGQVGMASAMVSVSALGIIVDDTVHLLIKYQRGRRELGMDRAEAVRYSLRTVGQAIIATTAILSSGFMVLALSSFRINFELGILTAIAITMALLADFFLLPSLLLWRYRREEHPS